MGIAHPTGGSNIECVMPTLIAILLTMIYIAQFSNQSLFKIGYTSGNSEESARKRIRSLQTGSPLPLHLYSYIRFIDRQAETNLHHELVDCRCSGEWFNCTPQRLDRAIKKELQKHEKAKLHPRKSIPNKSYSLQEDIELSLLNKKIRRKRLGFFQRLYSAFQAFVFTFQDDMRT